MTADKALAAFVISVIGLINTFFGQSIGLPVDLINSLCFVAAPAIVWAVRNRFKPATPTGTQS